MLIFHLFLEVAVPLPDLTLFYSNLLHYKMPFAVSFNAKLVPVWAVYCPPKSAPSGCTTDSKIDLNSAPGCIIWNSVTKCGALNSNVRSEFGPPLQETNEISTIPINF